MEQTSRQRNQCNPDRSHRKPLLRGLVNGKSHLRRNRRCRPPRQGTEKERREGNPIPTGPLTPNVPQSPNVSHRIPESPPFPSGYPHTHPHRSRLVRTVCTRRACNHFRKYWELVEPSCSRHHRIKIVPLSK